mmetsp:Transcript_28495/g.43818  ORF Transcript_28495/g.43818 Transcript_28495/m.43818 type:complete len:295 (+) Transcript_28495:48-932(+)
MGDRALGPLGIDPVHFAGALFCLLIIFVLYLLLPRGLRVHHFRAYPKRYAWSARSRARRGTSSRTTPAPGSTIGGSSITTGVTGTHNPTHRQLSAQGIGVRASSLVGSAYSAGSRRRYDNEDQITFHQNEEIVISAAMQQLRDPGVLIVAHGSRGKPKTVRLQLTESAITWRTETRKKNTKPKMGKLHQVPLSHIMYVDVGKQTTALRRVENASVSEALCFSLLTKEGSLDLEANSPRERDALVSCFSLVLDEVHAQNWREIYRGPSSDMPSSFDDVDHHEGDVHHDPSGVANV